MVKTSTVLKLDSIIHGKKVFVVKDFFLLVKILLLVGKFSQ